MTKPPPEAPASPKKPHKPASSGQHPAVKMYRAKLDSVDKSVSAATMALDQELERFLTDLKTPVPTEPPTPTRMPVLPPPPAKPKT